MASSLTRLNLSRARLLVVDDEEPSMEIVSSTLLGFGVTQARKSRSAAEARGEVAQLAFDLLLVDQEMPEEDGLAFCRSVRADPASRNYTTPLILLTALPSLELVAQARDAGAHFVIAKPVSPAVLLQRIEWIARSGRDFVTSDGYRGPDRRFQDLPPPGGAERRSGQVRSAPPPQAAVDARRD